MDPIREHTEALKRSTIPLSVVLIIGLQIVVALLSYPFLPPMVPMHWNYAGQVDSYAPKLLGVFSIPVFGLGLYIFLRLVLSVGPRLGRENQQATLVFVDRIMNSLFLFSLAIQLVMIATALGIPVNTPFVLNLAVSLLFLFIGNYLGKLRRNFWAGIRTPWTLSSDRVWERTHRLGGWLFVAIGIVGLITSFIPPLRLWVMLGAILLVIVILCAYSYLVYQRLESSGEEPLSPPFDRGS